MQKSNIHIYENKIQWQSHAQDNQDCVWILLRELKISRKFQDMDLHNLWTVLVSLMTEMLEQLIILTENCYNDSQQKAAIGLFSQDIKR